MQLHTILPSQLQKDGYVVIPDVLSYEEVQYFRQLLTRYFSTPNPYTYYFGGKTQSNAVHFIPELRSLLTHKNIIAITKTLIGEDAQFLQHSDAHYNMFSGWHKDTTGYIKNAWENREENESIGVYKIAFYLQDHLHDTNGFSLRKGSHLRPHLGEGAVVDIHSKAGDAIFFDQRLDHIGQPPNFLEKNIIRFMGGGESTFSILHQIRHWRGVADKFSIFMGFGKKNAFSEEFTKNTIKRQNAQNALNSGYS